MKKNITIYLLLALACLGLQSCLFQEENYFDDSSANRATADVNRCSELLKAAPNGWVMEYYIGKDYSLGGITLLCRFDGQRVTMASQMRRSVRSIALSRNRRRCCHSIPIIIWCIISVNHREVWPTTRTERSEATTNS